MRIGAAGIKPSEGTLPRVVPVEIHDMASPLLLLLGENQQRFTGKAALITIPLEKLPGHVYARITTETDRVVSVFEETAVNQPSYQKLVPLAPGVYKLYVTAGPAGPQPPDTSTAITFEVK